MNRADRVAAQRAATAKNVQRQAAKGTADSKRAEIDKLTAEPEHLGLEVKASRSDTSWQSHGPRADERDMHVAKVFENHPGEEVKAAVVQEWVAGQHGFADPAVIKGHVNTAITSLIKAGKVERVKPGVFRLIP